MLWVTKMNKEILVMFANFFAGMVAGYASFLLNSNTYAVVLMAAVGVTMKFVSEKILAEKKDFKWWLANCGVIYIFMWFISWVIFLNLWGTF